MRREEAAAEEAVAEVEEVARMQATRLLSNSVASAQTAWRRGGWLGGEVEGEGEVKCGQ